MSQDPPKTKIPNRSSRLSIYKKVSNNLENATTNNKFSYISNGNLAIGDNVSDNLIKVKSSANNYTTSLNEIHIARKDEIHLPNGLPITSNLIKKPAVKSLSSLKYTIDSNKGRAIPNVFKEKNLNNYQSEPKISYLSSRKEDKSRTVVKILQGTTSLLNTKSSVPKSGNVSINDKNCIESNKLRYGEQKVICKSSNRLNISNNKAAILKETERKIDIKADTLEKDSEKTCIVLDVKLYNEMQAEILMLKTNLVNLITYLENTDVYSIKEASPSLEKIDRKEENNNHILTTNAPANSEDTSIATTHNKTSPLDDSKIHNGKTRREGVPTSPYFDSISSPAGWRENNEMSTSCDEDSSASVNSEVDSLPSSESNFSTAKNTDARLSVPSKLAERMEGMHYLSHDAVNSNVERPTGDKGDKGTMQNGGTFVARRGDSLHLKTNVNDILADAHSAKQTKDAGFKYASRLPSFSRNKENCKIK